MARRNTTNSRRQSLADSLRESTRDGSLVPGDMLPTVRQLAERHQLSVRIVSNELQKLLDEGVLYTVPRVGTFVGQSPVAALDTYLLLSPDISTAHAGAPHINHLRIGFDERIAELGACSLTMPITDALEHRRANDLPVLAGVFDFASRPDFPSLREPLDALPRVRFAPPQSLGLHSALDTIYFDEVDGGRQVTQHLLRLGHRHVAYLGLHTEPQASELYHWSQMRLEGWRQAMKKAGQPEADLVFTPESEPSRWRDEPAIAAAAAIELVKRRDITAVVGANDHAVMGLFEALRAAGIPALEWPAVVGFDDLPQTGKYVLSSVRLPWEEVGRMGASLLYDRHNGRLSGPPQQRSIQMKLIQRISSRKHWRTFGGTMVAAA